MPPIRYFRPWRMWRRHELKDSYDVVIVGGGAHGLAIAYELAKRGIRDVAVLDKSYVGGGGTGRDTKILRADLPIMAALYHPPGGVIRHDAVVLAYARMADRLGVQVHQGTEVTGIDIRAGRVTGVRTNRGDIAAGTVISAVAGWTSEVCRMAGVETPIVTHPLQAFVTEALKPFLHVILVSATLHVYISQTDRGE